MNFNQKISYFLLSILFSLPVIAEIENHNSSEQDSNLTIRRSGKNFCCNPAIKGPRGPKGQSAFPVAFGDFYADPGQSITPTTPLDFSNFTIPPVRLQLTPPNEEGQSTGVIIQDTGVYITYYKANWSADQSDVETVASIALTVQKGGTGEINVINASDATFVDRISKVMAGNRYTIGTSWIIALNAGDILGLQCPSLKNFSQTALSNKAVTFTIQRIG